MNDTKMSYKNCSIIDATVGKRIFFQIAGVALVFHFYFLKSAVLIWFTTGQWRWPTRAEITATDGAATTYRAAISQKACYRQPYQRRTIPLWADRSRRRPWMPFRWQIRGLCRRSRTASLLIRTRQGSQIQCASTHNSCNRFRRRKPTD